MPGHNKGRLQLPVFLPGNNRDWQEIEGIATITERGEIHIRLVSQTHARELFRKAKDGLLLGVSFDYRAATPDHPPQLSESENNGDRQVQP